jgi:hypothetical protein
VTSARGATTAASSSCSYRRAPRRTRGEAPARRHRRTCGAAARARGAYGAGDAALLERAATWEAWNVDRRHIRLPRRLAQLLRVALVGLEAAVAHPLAAAPASLGPRGPDDRRQSPHRRPGTPPPRSPSRLGSWATWRPVRSPRRSPRPVNGRRSAIPCHPDGWQHGSWLSSFRCVSSALLCEARSTATSFWRKTTTSRSEAGVHAAQHRGTQRRDAQRRGTRAALTLRPSGDYPARTSGLWREGSRGRRHYIRSVRKA